MGLKLDDIDELLTNYFFGDGYDGNVTVSSGEIVLERDMYYNNLTINGTGSIRTNGWRIFVKGELDLTGAPINAIHNNGNDGGDASGITGGIAGAAIQGATVGGGLAGREGNNGSSAANSSGAGNHNKVPEDRYYGCNGGAGGGSGAGGTGTGSGSPADFSRGSSIGFDGDPFSLITPNKMFFNSFTKNLVSGVMNDNTNGARGVSTLLWGGGGGAGGSSGEGSSSAGNTGAGGGGASGAGVVFICANKIKRDVTTAESAISAVGGNGGNGSNSAVSGAGGGAGAGGGGGGFIYLVCVSLCGEEKENMLNSSGGNGGIGGNGMGAGTGAEGGMGARGGFIQVLNLNTNYSAYVYSPAGSMDNSGSPSGTTGGSGGSGYELKMNL